MVGSWRNTVVSDILFKGLVVVAFTAGIVGTAYAQAGPGAAGTPVEPNAANAPRDPNAEEITIVVGNSVIVRAPWPTSRVAVTNPVIAAVQVLTPEQVLVQGLKIGSTDLIFWSEDERQTWQRRMVVQLDVQTIRRSLQDLFPGASLQISSAGEVLLVRGLLRSADQADQLHNYLERSKVPYVDMTSVAGIQQVQLQVRVAEVSRRALRILGMNWFTESDDFFFGQRIGASGTGPLIPGINIGVPAGAAVGSNLDFQLLNDVSATPPVTTFFGFPDSDLEFFLQALAENQYMRILANPTLVALSGEQANFLAGGEFPIPVVQGSAGGVGATNAVTIEYKQFGVLLIFRPVVLGDGGIRLHAAQEVSQLTDVGAVVLQGFSIPALATRRAETTLELKSGQSFAMAGLLQHTNGATSSRLPGLGDIPVIGSLFRSVRYQNDETELIIVVTASLIEPINAATPLPLPGIGHSVPNEWELYLEGRIEGKRPARIDPDSAGWLRRMGLDQLVGPGAWDTYGYVPDAPPEGGT